jgi:hypothetical protein
MIIPSGRYRVIQSSSKTALRRGVDQTIAVNPPLRRPVYEAAELVLWEYISLMEKENINLRTIVLQQFAANVQPFTSIRASAGR